MTIETSGRKTLFYTHILALIFRVCKAGIALYTFIVSKILRIRKTGAALYAHILALVFNIRKAGITLYARIFSLVFRVNSSRTALSRALRMYTGCMAARCLRVGQLCGYGRCRPGAQSNEAKRYEYCGQNNGWGMFHC